MKATVEVYRSARIRHELAIQPEDKKRRNK